MKYMIAFCIICLSFSELLAQYTPTKEQKMLVEKMISAYNKQDYSGMQEPWMLLGKILITNKSLKKEFKPFYHKYGIAHIDTISCSSKYECTALLCMEKDPEIRKYLHFIYTDKNKLMGFGFGYPIFIYPKKMDDEPKAHHTTAKKTEIIDSLMNNNYLSDSTKAFNGCVLAIEADRIIYKNCFGYADRYKKTPLNDSTRFLLASCTKQFTAMGIMLLAEEGKLDVEDNIQKYFPELPYNNISIEHLLTHTSGLPDYMQLLKKYWDRSQPANNDDILELLKEHRPKVYFQPNEAFEYSNTAYVLLSIIIEKTSSMSYESYLTKAIFQPLGMDQTVVYARRRKKEIINNYALGYVYSNDLNQYILPDSLSRYAYMRYMDGITGDDGISSSISDLLIWNNALKDKKLLNEASYEKIFTRHSLNNGNEINYGYGFFLEGGKNAEPLIYHSGNWPGYRTMMLRFTEKDQFLVILSNNSYPRVLQMADDIASEMLK